jgi:hypothetical protein
MNKCLESCTGTAIIQWESQILSHIPKERRLVYIEENSPRLREIYCSEVCPVARFRRKYYSQQSVKEGASHTSTGGVHANHPADTYIFEGGINDNT